MAEIDFNSSNDRWTISLSGNDSQKLSPNCDTEVTIEPAGGATVTLKVADTNTSIRSESSNITFGSSVRHMEFEILSGNATIYVDKIVNQIRDS